MKLLLVLPDITFVGGDVLYVREMASYLAGLAVDVHVAELMPTSPGAAPGGTTVHANMDGVRDPASMPRFLADLVVRERIDVVHTHHFLADLVATIARLGTDAYREHIEETVDPSVTAVLDQLSRSSSNLMQAAYRSLLPDGLGPLEPTSFAWVTTKHLGAFRSIALNSDIDRIFAPAGNPPDWAARQVNAQLQGAVSKASDHIITICQRANSLWGSCGRPISYIPVVSVAPADVAVGGRRKAGSSAFLFLGRLGRMKNPTILAEAFRRHLQRHPDDTLTFAGEGPNLIQCKQIADGDPRIRFLGLVPRERVPGVFDQVDAFCLFSECEGLPLAIQEALSRGVPVLGTSVGGIPDLVADGMNGMLTSQQTVEAVSRVLGRFSALSDDRVATMRSRALATMSAMPAKEQAFHQHLDVYARQVTAQPATAPL